MDTILTWLFGNSGLTPHGYCLIWRDDLIFLYAFSDTAIALSYFAIPTLIFRVRRMNPDIIPAVWAYLFSGFIVSCGITHVFSLITLYMPVYGIASIAKLVCASISIVTAIFLALKHGEARNIPSVNALLKLTSKLKEEVEQRKQAETDLRSLTETLESRVKNRTNQLDQALKSEKAIQRELKSTMKMREEFLASISHDFKTPLNAIMGFSEAVKEKIFGDKLEGKNLEYIALIHKSGSMMRDYISRLVEVFQMSNKDDQLHSESFDFPEIIQEVVEESQVIAEKKGLKINFLRTKVITYHGDKILCHSLISNMVSNAIKYTDKGEITVDVTELRNGVAIKVTDTGCGIPAKDLPTIFNAFHRVAERNIATEGHGLGLTISRSIAQKHGGDINVKSKVNEGTTFTITLKNQSLIETNQLKGALPDAPNAAS